MGSQALRTLCLAHIDFKSTDELPQDWHDNPPDNADLCCDCIVGIIDPLREDVQDSIFLAQAAGITVRMVTGMLLMFIHTINSNSICQVHANPLIPGSIVTGDSLATACAIAKQVLLIDA